MKIEIIAEDDERVVVEDDDERELRLLEQELATLEKELAADKPREGNRAKKKKKRKKKMKGQATSTAKTTVSKTTASTTTTPRSLGDKESLLAQRLAAMTASVEIPSDFLEEENGGGVPAPQKSSVQLEKSAANVTEQTGRRTNRQEPKRRDSSRSSWRERRGLCQHKHSQPAQAAETAEATAAAAAATTAEDDAKAVAAEFPCSLTPLAPPSLSSTPLSRASPPPSATRGSSSKSTSWRERRGPDAKALGFSADISDQQFLRSVSHLVEVQEETGSRRKLPTAVAATQKNFGGLPAKLIARFLNVLPTSSRPAVALVNRAWNAASSLPASWQHIGIECRTVEHVSELLAHFSENKTQFRKLRVFDVRLEAPSCWEKKATRKAIGEAVSSVVTSSLEELNTYAAHVPCYVTRAPFVGSLVLRRCSAMSSHHLAALAQFSSLKHLAFPCQDMTDDCLRHVASLGMLRSLDLSFNPLVTDRGLAKLKGLLYLCELNLSYCDNVNDKALASIADRERSALQQQQGAAGGGRDPSKQAQLMRSLILDGCSKISDTGLCSLVPLANLRKLGLQHTAIQGWGFRGLLRCSATLEHLNVSHTSISARINPFLPQFSSLEELHITDCNFLTTQDLVTVVMPLTALRRLDVRQCKGMSDSFVERALHAKPRLQVFDARQTLTSNEALDRLSQRIPNLLVLYDTDRPVASLLDRPQ